MKIEEWRHAPAGLMHPKLCLRPAGIKGQGVFSLTHFNAGETLERVAVLVFPDPQWQFLNLTALQHHYYCWGSDSTAVAFGFGSFLNHSNSPNARCLKHFGDQVMELIAVRDIEPEEEVTIRYGCPLWFETV